MTSDTCVVWHLGWNRHPGALAATGVQLRPDLGGRSERRQRTARLIGRVRWRALGKLTAPDGLAALCRERDFEPVAFTFEHAERAAYHVTTTTRSTDRAADAYLVARLDPSA